MQHCVGGAAVTADCGETTGPVTPSSIASLLFSVTNYGSYSIVYSHESVAIYAVTVQQNTQRIASELGVTAAVFLCNC